MNVFSPEFATHLLHINNPGALLASDIYVWRGQSGRDDGGYCRFFSAVHGMRAMCVRIVSLEEYGRCRTLEQYVFGYYRAPYSAQMHMLTQVARHLHTDHNSVFYVHERAEDMLAAFVTYFIGKQPYSGSELRRALAASHAR